ncbi:MAG: hypothetical protein IIV99_07470 [Oscillospiraceae bacterium]|nr:hypothetical protein [Oscillospiraceae bacterium]
MATQITNYQCPACTGPLHFASESGMLECDYCQSKFAVEEIEKKYAEKNKTAEENFNNAQQNPDSEQEAWDLSGMSDQWGEDKDKLRLYTCPSCAAQIMCDEHTAATSCPYCGNPSIVPGQFGGGLKPDCLIPFKLDYEDAKKALLKYYKGKRFLPNEFTAKNKISELKGVYVPFWLVDCDADADITFDGTTAVTTRQGDYRVTTTSHYDIYRSGTIPFKNIPIDASKNMPDNLMDSIEPFDYNQLTPFSLSYLPGYMAERYGLTPQQCFQRMELRAENSAVDILRDDVTGFGGCSVKHKNIRISHGRVRYALLPVYMLTTKYKGEDYLFAMNGQSGKLIGNLPVCKKKFWAHLIGITAGITAVVGTALMLFL